MKFIFLKLRKKSSISLSTHRNLGNRLYSIVQNCDTKIAIKKTIQGKVRNNLLNSTTKLKLQQESFYKVFNCRKISGCKFGFTQTDKNKTK